MVHKKKELQQGRRQFDYVVVNRMAQSSRLISVQAFTNPSDLERRRNPIDREDDGGDAGYYVIHYDILSLVGRGKFHKGFDVTFDLISGDYPHERAENAASAGGVIATCVSRPIPWSPHFLDGVGTICLGSIWRGADHTLFGHVVIHVARLLNWDEPMMEAGYGGWNPSAIKWWKRNLHGKPITSGLDYPELPKELTHGTDQDAGDDFQILDVVATGQACDVVVVAAWGPRISFKGSNDGIITL